MTDRVDDILGVYRLDRIGPPLPYRRYFVQIVHCPNCEDVRLDFAPWMIFCDKCK